MNAQSLAHRINSARNMHENSLDTHEALLDTFCKRTELILEIFRASDRALSCRDVLDQINIQTRSDIRDMNYVRPRISELVKEGRLRESPLFKQIDRHSGRSVALYSYVYEAEQMELL